MHRFFVPKENIGDSDVRFSKEQAHQIRNVLRIGSGRNVIVLDNAGSEYEVVLTTVERDTASGRILAKRAAKGEPEVQITLFQALLTREKFEWVLQKCTEIGVARFVPVVTERTIVRDTSIKPGKFERWRQIITEAAEQSHRGIIPQLARPVTLPEALLETKDCDQTLIAYECEQGATLREALRTGPTASGKIAVFIGPEGGFAEHEVELAREHSAVPVSLGPRILRTETAAIVAASLILYELGQM